MRHLHAHLFTVVVLFSGSSSFLYFPNFECYLLDVGRLLLLFWYRVVHIFSVIGHQPGAN